MKFLLTLWTHIYPIKNTDTIGILGAEELVEVKTYFPSGSKVAPGLREVWDSRYPRSQKGWGGGICSPYGKNFQKSTIQGNNLEKKNYNLQDHICSGVCLIGSEQLLLWKVDENERRCWYSETQVGIPGLITNFQERARKGEVFYLVKGG